MAASRPCPVPAAHDFDITIHPHSRIEYGQSLAFSRERERGSTFTRTQLWHRLPGLAVMDFRFLAALGMTGIRGWIVATNPLCLPLSAHGGRGDKAITGLLCNILQHFVTLVGGACPSTGSGRTGVCICPHPNPLPGKGERVCIHENATLALSFWAQPKKLKCLSPLKLP